jgi:hypothetical protein
MKNILNLHFMLSLHLVVIVVVIVIASSMVHRAKEEVRAYTIDRIDTQIEYISEMLITTDNNGADEVIENIVRDCPNRNTYERLLGSLGSLTNRDLLTVQQLFESCGYFYAERKALMVAKIEREYEVLSENVGLLKTFDTTNQEYDLSGWKRLIDLEVTRSDMLKEQTEIQAGIISLLIEGRGVTDSEITGHVERARGLDESLSVLNRQIDELRDALMK